MHVTPTVLKLLARRSCGTAAGLSRQEITDQVWGEGTAITPRVVDTHLRQEVEPNPAEPVFLVGVRGVGYGFEG